MEHILYHMSKIIFNISSKLTDDPPIKIYVNNIETRIILKIKAGYFFQLLNSETMKSLRSTKNKVTKNENGKNMLPLKSLK